MSDKYEVVEKIGKGAYGNVQEWVIIYTQRVGIFGEGTHNWQALCPKDHLKEPSISAT